MEKYSTTKVHPECVKWWSVFSPRLSDRMEIHKNAFFKVWLVCILFQSTIIIAAPRDTPTEERNKKKKKRNEKQNLRENKCQNFKGNGIDGAHKSETETLPPDEYCLNFLDNQGCLRSSSWTQSHYASESYGLPSQYSNGAGLVFPEKKQRRKKGDDDNMVVKAEDIPGYRGDMEIDCLLKFINGGDKKDKTKKKK